MIQRLKDWSIGAGGMLVIVVIVFIALYFSGCLVKTNIIRVTKEIPGKPTVIYVPRTQQELQACADSVIRIKATFLNPGYLHIWSGDDCKYNTLGLELEAAKTWKKNIINLRLMGLGGYNSGIKKLDVLYGGSAGYTRMLSPMLGIGPDIIYLKSAVTPDWYAGAAVNVLCQFDDFKKWK